MGTPMPMLTLRVPDQRVPLRLPLARGEAALIGRRPSLEQLAKQLTPDEQQRLAALRLRAVSVDSALVSANHLLILHEGDEGRALSCRDLRSRNGSWLRLDSADWHGLPAQTSDLELELTSAWMTTPPTSLPAAHWTHSGEFPVAIRDVVSDWLERLGIAARVDVIDSCEDGSVAGWALPLAPGQKLAVHLPQGTTHEHSWQTLQSELATFVHEENRRFIQLTDHEDGLLFASPAIQAAHGRVADAAAAGMRLVLLGPTGSGKEILARCYQRHSVRRPGPFVAVNCALLRGDLLYAQLFGARRGSFTGCTADLPGLIESAAGGTLFLDEIGEMDSDAQRALLRFLDSRGEYQRLGDVRTRRADVQLVCATHVDLSDPLICRERFRDDLWYRLAVRVVRVPPLSERPEDIVAFLRTRRLHGTQLSVMEALSPAALERILQDRWPGNFRDLENFVSRLPVAVRAGSFDVQLVECALAEGRSGGQSELPRSSIMPSESVRGAIAPLSDAQWEKVSAQASRAFCQDFGGPPRGWGQMQTFTERYLKPVFVAQYAGLAGQRSLPDHINYSELARRLSVADGGTIKGHLLRYFDRFHPGRPHTLTTARTSSGTRD
ncbi:MAG: sigma-54-dependent Fis family transcriptional regulator [Elusimicrobia bacterium]|nr:MAG: sigma-54-dependent Fis family transcriptional regulator [Elusimicrobiota bacterium]